MGRACLELGSAKLQTMLGVLVGFGGTVGVTCPEWPCATSNGGGHPGVPGCRMKGTLTRQGTDGTHTHPLCQTGLSPCGGTGSVPMGRGDGDSGSTGDRGVLAGQASTGGSGVAPRSCHSHLCLLFFRDPDSDLREEEEAEMKATS